MSFLDEFGLAHVWQNIKTYIDDAVSGSGISGGGGTPDVPPGGIIIWSGSSDDIPDGWHLCDGTNCTPDLRGRFVLGESETYSIGETGGSEEVTLTVEQMPEHNHTFNDNTVGYASTKVNPSTSSSSTGLYNSTYAIPSKTSSSGSSEPHPNMPPYYVLAYIMKL